MNTLYDTECKLDLRKFKHQFTLKYGWFNISLKSVILKEIILMAIWLFILSYVFLPVSGQLPEGNCPPVRVRVWFRISVRIRVGGQFFSGVIVLEPFLPAHNH